jgi:uncharacterized glyoxalase superfamily protein PhnB
MAWLERTLGFEIIASYEGPEGKVTHAELALDGEVIMLGSVGAGDSGFDIAAGHASIYIVVDDPTPATTALERQVRRSTASCATRTTARAGSRHAIPRATCGASARTGRR